MLLTIEIADRPAADIAFLLHENTVHLQSVEEGFGTVHVF